VKKNILYRPGESIKKVELLHDNVLIYTLLDQIWRVWIDFDGVPRFERVLED